MCLILLMIFLFTMYLPPVTLAPGLRLDSAIQLVGILAMVILMLQKMSSKQKLQFQWPESYLMLGLIGVAGLSCFTALSPKVAVNTTGDLAKIAIVYFLIVNVADSEPKVRMATFAMIAGGLFPAIAILQNRITAGWNGAFESPKDLTYGLVVLIPLTIQLARAVRPIFRPLLMIASVLYTVAILANGSRVGVYGLLAALLVVGLRQSEFSTRLLTRALFVGTVLFLGSHWTTEAGAPNSTRDLTVPPPIDSVRTAVGILKSHPILGVGLGCSKLAWPTNAGADLEFSKSLVTNNTIVQALSEVGVLGFIPFALLSLTACIHAIRIFRSRLNEGSARSTALGLEGSLAGFVVCGMFGSYLVSWTPYIVLGLVSALSLILQSPESAKQDSARVLPFEQADVPAHYPTEEKLAA